jgi:hypothetical protein
VPDLSEGAVQALGLVDLEIVPCFTVSLIQLGVSQRKPLGSKLTPISGSFGQRD